jgi:hypothetical protein
MDPVMTEEGATGDHGVTHSMIMILSWLLVSIKGTATSSLTLLSVDSSGNRFTRHESMQYIALLSARPSGYLYLSITSQR